MSRRKRRSTGGGVPAPRPANVPAEKETRQAEMTDAPAPLPTAAETREKRRSARGGTPAAVPQETEIGQAAITNDTSPEPAAEVESTLYTAEPAAVPEAAKNEQEAIPDVPPQEMATAETEAAPNASEPPVTPLEAESGPAEALDAQPLEPEVEADATTYASQPVEVPTELSPSEAKMEQAAIPDAPPQEPAGGNGAAHFRGRSFLTLLDYTPEEITALLDLAALLKAKKKQGVPHRLHEGKNIALIFEKTSTRTRCSFEVAAADLGVHPTYLDPKSSQLGKKESIADTARVLGRMYDGIEYRGFGQEVVDDLAKYAGVPVWNGLTNEFHPTQVLADFLTIRERFGRLKGIKLVYLGDARYNMGNSLMVGCAKMGLDFVACAPAKYFPSIALVQRCRQIAAKTGATLRFLTDPAEAVKGAHVLYTDVWVSMGEPDAVWEERIADLTPYRVTKQLMDKARTDCVFMHCLPAFHDLNTGIGREIYNKFGIDCMEVTDEVFESESSIVFDEAENRMHTIKAVMAATL